MLCFFRPRADVWDLRFFPLTHKPNHSHVSVSSCSAHLMGNDGQSYGLMLLSEMEIRISPATSVEARCVATAFRSCVAKFPTNKRSFYSIGKMYHCYCLKLFHFCLQFMFWFVFLCPGGRPYGGCTRE